MVFVGEVDAADRFDPQERNAFEFDGIAVVAEHFHEFCDGLEFYRAAAFDVDDGVAVAGGFSGEAFVRQSFFFPEGAKELCVVHVYLGSVVGVGVGK